MKILRFAAVLALGTILLSSCTGAGLQNALDMKVSMEPQKIVVKKSNGYKEKSTIQWEITNRSSTTLEQQKFPLFIGAGRINDQSTTLFTELSYGQLNAGETKKGTSEKTFEAVVGATGDYELRFWINEKTEEGRMYQVKQTIFPFRWETP